MILISLFVCLTKTCCGEYLATFIYCRKKKVAIPFTFTNHNMRETENKQPKNCQTLPDSLFCTQTLQLPFWESLLPRGGSKGVWNQEMESRLDPPLTRQPSDFGQLLHCSMPVSYPVKWERGDDNGRTIRSFWGLSEIIPCVLWFLLIHWDTLSPQTPSPLIIESDAHTAPQCL